MSKSLSFQLASAKDKTLIRSWWTKPHVMEFWDNTPEAWMNVENYFLGKKELFDYWIASFDAEPFALLMTSDASEGTTPENPMFTWLAPEGLTVTVDFMIGEEKFLGLGLSYKVLHAFGIFLHARGVNALLIDPEIENKKAIHVYERAGFKIVESFIRKSGAFAGIEHLMMKMVLTHEAK